LRQWDKETGRQGEKERKTTVVERGGRAIPIAIGTRPPYSKRQGDDMSSEKERRREGVK